ncbi:flagellar assembly protein FliW [Georgenia sp. AZ-5]|uniref:flagellar assembly protein FliW n=1 Tax=Georgenia sp. AZ-5 TaxID=3367526 RepID=UPI0037547F05
MRAALKFVDTLPGLGPNRDFVLESVTGAEGLYRLTAERDADERLYLVDPSRCVDGYHPAIPEAALAHLALGPDEDPLVLVVVNPADGKPVVNLLAPILVNPSNGAAEQVILEGDDWPLRAALSRVGRN